jgi:hypothetical protein
MKHRPQGSLPCRQVIEMSERTGNIVVQSNPIQSVDMLIWGEQQVCRMKIFKKIMSSWLLRQRNRPLFSPTVAAARVATDEEERHPFLPSRSGLQYHATVSSSFWPMVYEEEDDAIASSQVCVFSCHGLRFRRR